MEIIKIFRNGKAQGVYAITDKDEVINHILDNITEENKPYAEMLLKDTQEGKGVCVIPKGNQPFDWDENLHGQFIK